MFRQSGPRPLQAILKKWKTEVVEAEENKCGERSSSGSRPSNRMEPRQEDSEFKALECDGTLGYAGEGARVPDLGSLERCNVCDVTPWRVLRGGNAGKCERCKNVRKSDTEMVKCRVCAWRICARCHNLETRGEIAPPPPEIRDHADHDHEMPDQNDTAEDDEALRDGANPAHPGELVRTVQEGYATITFIPHRMSKRFARVYSSKLNELSSHMQRGEDTLKLEMLNLLVWAMPALILSEDEASTVLHKEHHSRSAGLNQRLAEAERDEWGCLIRRAHKKQQDEEERKTRTPTIWRSKNRHTSGE